MGRTTGLPAQLLCMHCSPVGRCAGLGGPDTATLERRYGIHGWSFRMGTDLEVVMAFILWEFHSL